MSREELMKKISALDFAKFEAQLFLDTHPECEMALEYFNRTMDELNALRAEYVAKYGPMVAEDNGEAGWKWVSSPWPWQAQMSDKGGRS